MVAYQEKGIYRERERERDRETEIFRVCNEEKHSKNNDFSDFTPLRESWAVPGGAGRPKIP